VLSKDILSQVDGLITFKLTSSQDRDAIGAWVEGSAEKQQWRDIWTRLPTMQRGQGVVWVPGRGILSTVTFPEKTTFDSSRTPKRGESKRTAQLKPINLDKLEQRLASVKAEVDANDPKALRPEITRLKAELAKKPATSAADPAAIEAADRHGFDRGFRKGFEDAVAQARQSLDVHRNLIGESIKNSCASITHTLSVLALDLQIPNDIPSGSPTGRTVPTPTRAPVEPQAARLPSPAARGENDVHRFARGVSIERREECEHEPPFRGFGADRAQIQDTAFGHAGDGFADQRAGMLGDRQIAARAAEDNRVMRGGRRSVGRTRSPHHTPSGSMMTTRPRRSSTRSTTVPAEYVLPAPDVPVKPRRSSSAS
jgi:uncharacterized small protein (DUF1192 family)